MKCNKFVDDINIAGEGGCKSTINFFNFRGLLPEMPKDIKYQSYIGLRNDPEQYDSYELLCEKYVVKEKFRCLVQRSLQTDWIQPTT